MFHVVCTICQRFVFRALHQCQRTVILQSNMGLWFERLNAARSSFPQSWTAREKLTTSWVILLQPVRVSCSQQLFSLSRTVKRIPCTIVESCGCAQHDTFTESDTFPCNSTLYVHSHGNGVWLSKSCKSYTISLETLSHDVSYRYWKWWDSRLLIICRYKSNFRYPRHTIS